MYEEYWGLQFPPFSEAHDEAVFVPSDPIMLAWAKLVYVAGQGSPAAAVSGPAGVGKTMLARRLLKELRADGWAATYMPSPLASPEAAFTIAAHDLGGVGNGVDALVQTLSGLARDGKRVCLALDDAHAARTDFLESLRTLLNIETPAGGSAVTIFLFGQDGLINAMRKASSFDSRLALSITLPLLTEEEVKTYILSRLKAAGCHRGIFTRSAAERVCSVAAGLPRRINRVCDLALVTAMGLGKQKISSEIVDMVCQELGLTGDAPELNAEMAAVGASSSENWDVMASLAPMELEPVAAGAPAEDETHEDPVWGSVQ